MKKIFITAAILAVSTNASAIDVSAVSGSQASVSSNASLYGSGSSYQSASAGAGNTTWASGTLNRTGHSITGTVETGSVGGSYSAATSDGPGYASADASQGGLATASLSARIRHGHRHFGYPDRTGAGARGHINLSSVSGQGTTSSSDTYLYGEASNSAYAGAYNVSGAEVTLNPVAQHQFSSLDVTTDAFTFGESAAGSEGYTAGYAHGESGAIAGQYGDASANVRGRGKIRQHYYRHHNNNIPEGGFRVRANSEASGGTLSIAGGSDTYFDSHNGVTEASSLAANGSTAGASLTVAPNSGTLTTVAATDGVVDLNSSSTGSAISFAVGNQDGSAVAFGGFSN